MSQVILYTIVAVLTLVALAVSHIILRKSIAQDAKDLVGNSHQLYLEKEWEEELVIEDPRVEKARKIDERFSQVREMRQALQLYKHQEARRKRALGEEA